MIGFYDYTVILTFVGLLSTVFGMTQAMDGHFRIALICLALSGLCDTFDGRIARTKADRTRDQRLYGIQLDSLCDVVCFGVFPAMICYLMGTRGLLGGLSIGYYCVCGVIRLAYFNVLETGQLYGGQDGGKVYHGLPITSISVILPLTFLLGLLAPEGVFHALLAGVLLAVGTLFIVDFRLRKPKDWMIFALIGIVACALVVVVLFSRYRVARRAPVDGTFVDEIPEDCSD